MIRVAPHIGLNNVRKGLRILNDILLQIPCPTYRNFLAKDEPMMSSAFTDQKSADHRTSRTQGQQRRSFRSVSVGAKKLHLDTLVTADGTRGCSRDPVRSAAIVPHPMTNPLLA